MMGPTGIGVLWARRELLDAMPPFLGGGGMILDVKLDSFRPARASGPVRGGHAAHRRGRGPLDRHRLPRGIGMDRIRAHERALTAYALGSPGRRSSAATAGSSARPPATTGAA